MARKTNRELVELYNSLTKNSPTALIILELMLLRMTYSEIAIMSGNTAAETEKHLAEMLANLVKEVGDQDISYEELYGDET